MFIGDFYGITPQTLLLMSDSDIKFLSMFKDKNKLVQHCRMVYDFLNGLEIVPSPLTFSMVADELSITASKVRIGYRRKDEEILKCMSKYLGSTGMINIEANGVSLTEDERKILTWYYRKREKLIEHMNYEVPTVELFGVSLKYLAMGYGQFKLYSNYKMYVHDSVSLYSAKRAMEKIELIESLNQDVLSNKNDVYLGKNRAIMALEILPALKNRLNEIVERIEKNFTVASLNFRFDVDFTEDDYYNLGVKLSKMGFIGFNIYLKELFEMSLRKENFEGKSIIIKEDLRLRLDLLKMDLRSLTERLESRS